ncbi:hypothetical protein BH11BAC7_BH11BAC7_21460 [soil metagenome]
MDGLGMGVEGLTPSRFLKLLFHLVEKNHVPSRNKKKHQYKIRENDPENGICQCKVNGEIDPNCFENIGVCPSLKIIAIFDGHKVQQGDCRYDVAFLQTSN